jgi:hypothetical protein
LGKIPIFLSLVKLPDRFLYNCQLDFDVSHTGFIPSL